MTMSNQQGIGAGGVLMAFAVGAAVGAAVALLFAPATGEETREYLGERAREGRDRATEAARQGRDMVNRGRETLTTAFDRAREQFQAATRESGSDA
jgi:gas vesicle protein